MMNGQRYDIPRNFIVTLSHNPDGTAGAISMRALLPDLAGLTPENMHCLDYRDPCSDNIVTIGLLEKHHSVPGSRLLDNIRALAQPEKFSGPCGLDFYESRGIESQRMRYFFKRMRADADFSVLKCAKEGSSYAPRCSSNYDMDDGNHFYYMFNRKFLCDWEGIKDKILERIASFRAEAGKWRMATASAAFCWIVEAAAVMPATSDGSSLDTAVLRNIESPPCIVNGGAVLPRP
jgi:hypothetical protein